MRWKTTSFRNFDLGDDNHTNIVRCVLRLAARRSEEFSQRQLVAFHCEQIKFAALRPCGGDELIDFYKLWRNGIGRAFHGTAVNNKEPKITLLLRRQRLSGAETNHGNFFTLPIFNRAAG